MITKKHLKLLEKVDHRKLIEKVDHLKLLEKVDAHYDGDSDDYYHLAVYSDMSGRVMLGKETITEFEGEEGLTEALRGLLKL